MRAVAFLRNFDNGRRGSPTSDELVAAFLAAGAATARPVRGNGTVVVEADDPQSCTAAAVAALGSSGWRDVGFAKTVDVLRGALHGAPEDDPRWELSVFAAGAVPDPPLTDLPLAGRRCEVVAAGLGWALTRNDRDRESFATPTLERALGRPVTSRAVATVRAALG